MKISIITIVFNGAKTIDDCINSVLSQDYPDIEYIIVDGGSKDGTVEKVKGYGAKIARFLSEADNGIYDAMNKGIELATGDVVGILNADDFYAGNTVISKVVKSMSAHHTEGCYGDLEYIDSNNADLVKRKWISGNYEPDAFLYGWMPPHPTFFIRKACYQKWGKFRLDMGSAADYELMLRMIYKQKITVAYVPEVLVKMRTGGVSNSTISNRWRANRNDRKAWEVNDLKPWFFTLIMKPLRKIMQFM